MADNKQTFLDTVTMHLLARVLTVVIALSLGMKTADADEHGLCDSVRIGSETTLSYKLSHPTSTADCQGSGKVIALRSGKVIG